MRAQDGGLSNFASPDHIQIAGLRLDLRQEELRDSAGERIGLRRRSFGVLRHLALSAGRVVPKDELLGANWPGLTVTEDSLTQCIAEIRRLLGASGRDVIRTVARRGYVLCLPNDGVQAARPVGSGPTVAVWPFEADAAGSLALLPMA